MPITTRIRSAKRMGFSSAPLYVKNGPKFAALRYLKYKSSFFIAAFSLCAFVSGNMLGEHGWHAFWKSVMGAVDDSVIVYTGTVTPVAYVPDYTRWSLYGGNADAHTYRQVPKDLLIPLPSYDASEQKRGYEQAPEGDVYSIGHMGSYQTGAEGEGSHPGVDIRVPEGTPVRAIANGIVTRVHDDTWGFGKLIVIRHPHSPDPDDPKKETVLHSAYAHLSAQYVAEGDIVEKGQEIGLSGKTGFATGPHLHFQIDRNTFPNGEQIPWHPFWPFSTSEARDAGMTTTQAINGGLNQSRGFSATVHPMLYLQANYPPVVAYRGKGSSSQRQVAANRPASTVSSSRNLKDRAEARKASRLKNRIIAVKAPDPQIVQSEVVAAATKESPLSPSSKASQIASIQIDHDRTFTGREWEKVRLTLLDAGGVTVKDVSFGGQITLQTAYGEAEFQPKILKASDFIDGVVDVKMLPFGRRTIVILVQPYQSLSSPMQFRE